MRFFAFGLANGALIVGGVGALRFDREEERDENEEESSAFHQLFEQKRCASSLSLTNDTA
jgi:hypothetical protein